MTVAMFITMMTGFSTLTGLFVQGIKKILDEKERKYSANLLACIVGCIVGIGGTAAYYAIGSIAFTTINVVCMVLMGVAVSLGAMVGYDKVVQMISQFRSN